MLEGAILTIAQISDLDVPALAQLVSVRSRSVARRLGWLLDMFRDDLELKPLRAVARAEDGYPTRLVRALPARGAIDTGWNLQINASVEPDL